MEKIKSFLLSTNFAVLALMLIVGRIVVCGATVGDAIAVLAVAGLQGFYRWLDHNKVEPLNEQVAKQLEDIKANVSGLMIKNSVKPNSQDSQGVRKFF